MLPVSLTSLIVSFLGVFTSNEPLPGTPTSITASPERVSNTAPIVTDRSSLQFHLRHLHAVSTSSRVVFSDVGPRRPDGMVDNHPLSQHSVNGSPLTPLATHTIRTTRLLTTKPKSPSLYEQARVRSLRHQESVSQEELWEEPEEVEGPDVEDRKTLLELAKMANDAYLEPGDPEWYELDEGWKTSYPFGWEPDADGFRGNVFATADNSTIVVAIKGTSAGFFGGGGPTARKDKLNDNLLFSCCCARVDWTWTTVCDCYRGGGGKCDINCLEEALAEESLFYPIGTNLYNNLTYMYPDSDIWLVGHSLGGALASLVGITFGMPVVTFESPGEKLAAKRLHLPSPPSLHHVTHVYHTADPIAMGTCNGVLSSCALGGYAMETKCHLGKTILYDTVSVLNWGVDVRKHGIVNIIEELLANPWPPSVEEGREVPKAKPEDDCVECYSYEFGDFPLKSVDSSF